MSRPWTRIAAAALLAAALGCTKKTDPSEPSASTGAQVAASVKLAAPETVIAFGGTGPLTDSAGKIVALARQAVPALPDLSQQIAPILQNEWRLKDAAVIDPKQPLHFAVFDPKAFGPLPTAVIVGVTQPEAFLKALPEHDQKQGDGGNALSYRKFQGASRAIYVNFVGQRAVITRHPDAFPKHKAFLETLAQAPMPALGAAWLELGNLTRIFSAEVAAGLDQMDKLMQLGAQAQPGGEASLAVIKPMTAWVRRALPDLAFARATLADAPDGLRLELAVEARAGTPLAGQLQKIEGTGATALLSALPADALALISVATDPQQLKILGRPMMHALLVPTLFDGDAGKAEPYLKAMDDYLDGSDGEIALAAFTGANGMEMAGMFGIRDGAKVRGAFKAMTAMYSEPSVLAYYEKLGVSQTWQPEAYEVAGVKVAVSQTDMKSMPPEAAQLMGVMGDFMTQHFALTDRFGVLAYGQQGRSVIEGLLNKTLKTGAGAQASVKRALGVAAKKHLFFGWINPIAFARSLKLGGMNPLAGMLAGLPAESGLALSVGADGAGLQLVIDLPVALVKEGMAAFEKTKGAL